MNINTANLEALRVGFKTEFQRGLGQAATAYARIATTVPSTTKENRYGWLNKIPSLRKWVGPRMVHGISESDYAIKNITFELTVGVDRDDIRDDNLGTYSPMFVEMGESVSAQPDELVFGILKDGWATECYDRQFFFDTDHPVIQADGSIGTVANTDGGAGAPWFLLCTRRSLKPVIFQEREAPNFVAKDNPADHNVFNNKEFVYGVDCRRNVGFGFWQMAWGSKQPLTADNYAKARAAILSMKGDHGRPLGLVPDLLLVSPALEGQANKLMKNDQIDGSDNEWKGTAEVMVSPWLA